MKTTATHTMRRALAVVATGLAVGGMFAASSRADMYRMNLNSGGGVPAQATLNPLAYTPTNCTLSWYGLQGWYTVQATTNVLTGPWTSLVTIPASDFAWQVTVTNPDQVNNYSFRLSQANAFSGSSTCSGCHGDKYTPYSATAHASAYAALVNSHMNNSASCLPCHTVGYGQPTGFTDPVNTPNLENVGCENCHGAAGWHKNSDHSLILPAVSIAPEICGSCHQGHDPQYNEYITTLHAQVNDDVKYGFDGGSYFSNVVVVAGKTLYGYYLTTNNGVLVTNATTGIVNSSYVPGSQYDPGADRQVGCGMCHSGATRMAMLNDYTARQSGVISPLALPSAHDSGSWGPTCAVCHDPHGVHLFTNQVLAVKSTNYVGGVATLVTNWVPNTYVTQMRNPTWSTQYFTMPTTADKRYAYFTNYDGSVSSNVVFYGTTFSSAYDPNVNVCGQCHNTRGARWDGRGFGLITNYVVGPTITNTVYTSIVTNIYTTNYNGFGQIIGVLTNSYVIGRTSSTVVSTPTNAVITTGLTMTTNGFSRAPHLSAQYNMLVGIMQPDYLNTNALGVATNYTATHSGIAARSVFNTNQCATCHMPSYVNTAGQTISGHTFELDENGCALGGCHTSGAPTYQVTQAQTQAKLGNLVALLNYWAGDQGPSYLGTSAFGVNGWEYTMPGNLASINSGVNNGGPSSSQQLKLPASVLQARFDAYMIYSDGSFGVHNPGYTTVLFNDAENKLLAYYPIAGFKAKGNPYGAPGAKIGFTNNIPGATNWVWNFGDGNSSTAAMPTNTYANVGTYSVSLTAIAGGVSQTLVRTNYITIANNPTVSFTSSSPAITNTVVTFDGTSSSGVLNYKWTFYYPTPTNRVFNYGPTCGFIFTNAGTYNVSLTGANIAGSVTVTNAITVTTH